MMNIFKKGACLKQYIGDRVIKDIDLKEVTDIVANDYMVIFDENESKKISLSNLINKLANRNRPAVVTVTRTDSNEGLTMEEAISAIPENKKKLGLIITYKDIEQGWSLIQYTPDNLTLWNSVESWGVITTNLALDTLTTHINNVEKNCLAANKTLTDNFNQLNSNFSALSSDYQRHINETKPERESIIRRLTMHSNRIVDLENADTNFEHLIGVLSANVGTNTTNVPLADRVTDLEDTGVNIATTLNKHSTQINTANTNITTLTENYNTLNSEVMQDRSKLSEAIKAIAALNARVTALENK